MSFISGILKGLVKAVYFFILQGELRFMKSNPTFYMRAVIYMLQQWATLGGLELNIYTFIYFYNGIKDYPQECFGPACTFHPDARTKQNIEGHYKLQDYY